MHCAYLLFVLLGPGILLSESALQHAAELTRQGQYAQARKLMEGVPAPETIPQQIAFHRLKAAIASGLTERNVAAREMEDALTLAPREPNLLIATAVAELAAGFFDDALTHAKAASQTAFQQTLIGDIQQARKDLPAAISAYQAAVTLAPDDEHVRLVLGLALLREQRFEGAAEALKAAARQLPHSPKIHTLLGIAQYAQGYSDEAIQSLVEAATEDRQNEGAHAALAKIVLQSSAAPAQRTMDVLCGWNRVVCSALQLRVARKSGDARLLAEATKILQQSPWTDAVGRCELARAYEWEARWKEAQTQLERCVELDPTPQNHYRLGLLYRRRGLPVLAEREMAKRNKLLQSISGSAALGLDAVAAASQ